ncbi:MAG: metallophosphoesterase [Betaproteobacteria bacterium]
MGDMPYSQPQANLLDDLIDRVNTEPLAFVVHVGDITSGRGPCGNEWMEARKKQFERFKAPFVLLPGDNDWTDCHREGMDPRERLQNWRRLFCVPVALDAFVRQRGPYCENVRWIAGNHVFVGLNVQGSNNNLNQDPEEMGERMPEVYQWLDEAAKLARGHDGLVVLMQANPFLKPRFGGANGFDGILQKLRELGQAMPGRVLLVNGDTHSYRNDEPLPGLRRVEVYGSPHLRWLRATVRERSIGVEPVLE